MKSNAQTNGLNFQGVARNASGVILASQKISLKFSIIANSENGTIEYVESRHIITNAQGIFSVVIGDTGTINTIGSFTNIVWKQTPKFLKVEMDPAGGSAFVDMGTTQLQKVPYAYYASGVNALNIDGVLPAASGGTGVSSLSNLKSSLALDLVNNTTDINKPISNATQTALDLKANSNDVATSLSLKASITDMTTNFATKLNIADTSLLLQKADTITLSNRINLKANTIDVNTALDLKANVSDVTSGLVAKVDKVAGKSLSTEDYTLVEKNKLAAISGTNTGDQDLSAYASLVDLAFKANVSDVTTGLTTKLNITDTSYLLQKADTITLSNRINLKANTADVNTGLTTKFNVTDTSLLLQKADTITLSNRVNLKANTIDVNTALDLKANASDVTTVLLSKANATDVTTSLSSKVDKVDGKELSTNDYTTLEKSKLAAITGANTGDETEASIKSKLGIAVFFSGAYSDLTDKPDLTLKENLGNKTIDFITDAESDIKYPTVKAVKGYVDAANATLLNGVVSLSTNQTIEGKKTLINDLIMGAMVSVAGTTTPTTINFANGSMIGDIQNIFEGNPTNDGSIDLYAPDRAKWVQLNYGNTNYISLDGNGVYFYIGDLEWNFLKMGNTELPGNLDFKNHNGNSEINSDNELDITSQNDVRLRHWYEDRNSYSYTRLGLFEDEASLLIEHNDVSNEWNFKVDGSSWFPGDLNFTENHAINFLSAGTSTPTSNASINSTGPFLKIQTRPLTPEDDTDAENGISLEYENLNNIKINSSGVQLYTWNTNNGTPSFVDVRESSFNFLSNDNSNNQNRWYFNGADASTNLPGKLNVSQKAVDDFGLTITSPRPDKPLIQDPDKLGSSIGFISDVNSGTTSNTAFIQLNPQGDMVFRTLQRGMLFQNYGNGDFEFKFKIPEDLSDPTNIIPEYTKTTMSINNDNVHIDGSLTIGNTNYPKLSGSAGQVLTMDNDAMNAIWVTPSNTVSSTSNITSINGVSSGTQSLTTGNTGDDFKIESNSVTGVHTFNLPDASTTNRGLLTRYDYSKFDNKQNALTNPLTGTGTSGQLSFFNGTSTVTSSSNLFWDATNIRLGIRSNNPAYPFEINQGSDNYGFMLNAPSSNRGGSTIGFQSNVGSGSITKTGLFQLGGDGAMVFRTFQNNMYFDNFGDGSINFRVGTEGNFISGMTLDNHGNLEVAGTLKLGNTTFTKETGVIGDVLTNDGFGNAIWHTPTGTGTSTSVDASTLSGTTLNTTITGSSLTSVGILNSATVNGKVIVGSTSEVSGSAVFEASSTTQGFLPPRMSYYQRTQITSPVAGLTIWCNNCGLYGEMQVFNGGAWTNMVGGSAISPITLAIGDSYQGGKVAYILQSGDLGFDANTQHGIIAATSDQSSSIWWTNIGYVSTGATGTTIGTGFANTMKIISTQGGTLSNYAAGLARTYNGGGYNDWYLPSIDELKKLYQNRVAIGGFSGNNLWSSSEIDNGNVFTFDFWDTGLQMNIIKLGRCSVRAIRSF